ncbi:hypothetical protein PR048_005934 [Dryococelus australis]|uniref:UDP-glucuronosyltransferase n=1 Tax=Dryococelus australis TaxID=614101 RepID=A0ABQ9I9J8_9NEOP|nr:hypothetical protein PR048_005934 [Dryococelus australis]
MSVVSCKVVCSALILAAALAGEGARILGVFPVPSLSHQVVYRALMTELASRGHELVVITPEPIRDPAPANYTQIDVSFMFDFYRKQFNFASMKLDRMSQYDVIVALLGVGERLCEMLLDHKPVTELISPNSMVHFDLVFVEWLDMLSLYSFAHKFSAPMIGISSLPPFGIGYSAVGNPINPSYIPDIFMPYSDQMTFFERMDNFIYYMRMNYFFYSKLLPRHQAIADRTLRVFSSQFGSASHQCQHAILQL